MKRFIFAILLLSVVSLGVCSLSSAQQTTPRKWSQLPDMELGFDIDSYTGPPWLLGDDWLCTNGLPITDIHWWGSYSDWAMEAPPEDTITGFYLAIYAGTTIRWDHIYAIDEVNESYYGLQTYTGHSGFEYFVILDAPFEQEKGQNYWLAIASFRDTASEHTWGWKTTDPDSRYDCGASLLTYGGWNELYYSDYVDPTHPYYNYGPVDMAFELTTIPEPAALIMLGSLATGLFGIARVKRRFL